MSKFLSILVMLMIAGCGSDESPVGSAGNGETSTKEPLVDLSNVVTATPPPPCSDLSADFIAGAEALFEKWDDARELAGSTPRADLSGPVASLQEIKREATALESPECAADVRNSLVQVMESTISGFLSFMSDDDESVQEMAFEIAGAAQDFFVVSLTDLKLDTMSDKSFLTYYVFSSSLQKGIKYRDGTGNFVEENVRSPWSASYVVPSGFLARVEITATTADYTCAILFNGQVSTFLEKETIGDLVCRDTAP